MIHITKIYLVTNCYNDPNKVYIGKTTTSRKSKHKYTYGNQITYDYIDEISSVYRKDWEPLETYWIEQFRQWGFEVVNKNKKGGGGTEFVSEETKEKLRKPKSNEWKNNLKCPRPNSGFYGERSELTKQKISKANSKPKPFGFGGKLSKLKSGKSSNKKGIGKSIIQYDLEGNLIKVWENGAIEISFSLGKKPNLIYDCCGGKVKTAYGYKWKYKI